MKKILLMFGLSFFLSACGGNADFVGGINEDDNGIENLKTEFSLQDNLRQESSNYLQGEVVRLLLSVTNNGNEEVVLKFSSGQQYDFYVQDSEDVEIWRWSANRLFTQALSEISIPVGVTVNFSELWDQTATDGQTLARGSYTAFGKILGLNELTFELNVQ